MLIFIQWNLPELAHLNIANTIKKRSYLRNSEKNG